MLNDPGFEQMYPFSKRVRDLIVPEFRWLDKQGSPNPYFPQIKGVALLKHGCNPASVRGQFTHCGRRFRSRQSWKTYTLRLPIRATIRNGTQSQDTHSSQRCRPTGGK